LGWVAEHKNGYPESGIAQVQPTSWMPANSGLSGDSPELCSSLTLKGAMSLSE